MNNNSEVRAPI